jgi:hypothetical protein
MNQSKIREIKQIMGYQGLPEQKRLLRRFKKSYARLNEGDKVRVVRELKEKFNRK